MVNLRFWKGWVWPDYFVVFSALLFITAHLLTQTIAVIHTDFVQTAEEAQAINQAVEANPWVSVIINSFKLSFIYGTIVAPALVLATYIVVRRRWYKKVPWVVEQIALVFFFISLSDVMNDAAYLLGLALR